MFLNYVIMFLGFLLIFIADKKRNSMLITIVGILVTAAFIVMITTSGANNAPFDHLSLFYFENMTYATAIVFSFAFIIGVALVLLQGTVVDFREMGLIFIYFASAIGAIFSENIIFLFAYLKLLSVLGTLIILKSNHLEAKRVAIKYSIIHTLAGMFLMIGFIDYINIYDTADISFAIDLNNKSHYFILIGILISLGLPPFSSWIIEGYSKCSPNAALFLSIFTTKVNLFVLMKLFYGNIDLIYFGIIISVYGAIFSVFSNNLREIISFSIIHQIGIFIIAIAATDLFYEQFIISFIVVNILYKFLFFTMAILFLKVYGTENINDLKKTINLKSVIGIFLIIATLQSLGFPFTGGFIAKSYLSLTVANLDMPWLNYFLLFISSLIALNIGFRVPYALINFKNTSQNIFYKKPKILSIILIIIFLQLIFAFNMMEFLTYDHVSHVILVIALGLIMYYITFKLLANRQEVVPNLIHLLQGKLKHYTLYSLERISNINFNGALIGIFQNIYHRIPNINSNNYYVANASLIILITFIVLYFIIRL